MHVRSLIGNNQRAFELTHVRRVDTEVCLQRNIDMHTFRHVDERSTGPCGGVQCREFVVVAWNALAEILLDDFRIFLDRSVGVDENHALVFEILLDRVVDDFGFILCRDAGDKTAFFRFRNAKLVIRRADLIRQFLPGRGLLVNRLDVILEIVGVKILQIDTPLRHRTVDEIAIAFQSLFQHPFRLVLICGNGAHDVLVNAFFCRFSGEIRVMPSVRIVAELLDDFVILLDFIFVHSRAISHILAHLHVSCGIGRLVLCHRTLPPITRLYL